MPVISDLEINLSIDDVLRAQGADPEALRARRPRLLDITRRALDDSLPLLKPTIIYKSSKLKEIRHEEVILEGGRLTSPLLPRHLAGAIDVIAAVCTIGDELEKAVSQKMVNDVSYGYAMDAVGTAAADALGEMTRNIFADDAAQKGLKMGRSLSPGMIDWPIDIGQPQIFNLVEGENSLVHLSPGMQMIPRKSTSFVVGIGENMDGEGLPCEFCAQKETCIYKIRRVDK